MFLVVVYSQCAEDCILRPNLYIAMAHSATNSTKVITQHIAYRRVVIAPVKRFQTTETAIPALLVLN